MSEILCSWEQKDEGAGEVIVGTCNLKCHNCFFTLSGDQNCKKVFDNILDLNTLHISGGEPFLIEGLPEFLRKIRKKVKIISIKTNGTFPSKLRYVTSEWLVDKVELWLNAPVISCKKYCGVDLNPDLFIASLTTLQNWAGEQEFIFVIRDNYVRNEINIMADILGGSRKVKLLIKKDLNISDEIINRFQVNSGSFEVAYF